MLSLLLVAAAKGESKGRGEIRRVCNCDLLYSNSTNLQRHPREGWWLQCLVGLPLHLQLHELGRPRRRGAFCGLTSCLLRHMPPVISHDAGRHHCTRDDDEHWAGVERGDHKQQPEHDTHDPRNVGIIHATHPAPHLY